MELVCWYKNKVPPGGKLSIPTFILYIDMYVFEPLMAPVGFKCWVAFPLSELKVENPYLKATILEVVDTQIVAIVKETYQRLLDSGYTNEIAREMIAGVLLVESANMLGEMRMFDEEKYTRLLEKLPESSY